MIITILGSGVCASQLSGIPNRLPPAYLVETQGEKILFECSESIRFRLEQAGHDYTSIHHIAISHPHPDHNALIHYLQSVLCKGLWNTGTPKNEKLTVYCPDYISKHFPEAWNYYLPEWKDKMFPWPQLHFVPLSNTNKKVSISKNVGITAYSVSHGHSKTDALAFRLESPEGVFAYSGDTGLCQGIREATVNADLFICEASARIGDNDSSTSYGHLNPFNIGQIAQEARVKKVVLVHYIGLDSDQAMIDECRRAGFGGEITVGKDFQTLLI